MVTDVEEEEEKKKRHHTDYSGLTQRIKFTCTLKNKTPVDKHKWSAVASRQSPAPEASDGPGVVLF